MISIIIPAYNVERYIARSIECCLKQTYSDIEVVVINDGSTDSTSAIVKSLSTKDSRIILVEKANGGLVSARKEALQHVSGDFVFFLDADDIIDENTIESLAQYTKDYDVIVADFLLENENGKVLPCQHKNKKVFADDKIGLYSNFLSKSITASLCGRLIRTDMLKDFSTPIHITTGEDVITNLIMVKNHNPRIKVINIPFYHYIQYPHSMANTKNRKTLMKRVEYAQWVLDFMRQECLLDNVLIRPHLQYLLLDEYYSFLRDGGKVEYCPSFCKLANFEFWNDKVLGEFPIWKRLVLKSYHYNEYLGIFVRNALNIFRKLLK